MSGILELFGDASSVALTAVLQVLVAIIAAVAISLVIKINKNAKLNLSDSQLVEIKDIVNTMVVATNQKIVDSMKATNADGKLTEEQQLAVFNTVKTALKSCLDSDQVQCIEDKFGLLDQGLDFLIEESVKYNHPSTETSIENK